MLFGIGYLVNTIKRLSIGKFTVLFKLFVQDLSLFVKILIMYEWMFYGIGNLFNLTLPIWCGAKNNKTRLQKFSL